MARSPRATPDLATSEAVDASANVDGPIDPDPSGDADHVTPDDLALSGSAAAGSSAPATLAPSTASAVMTTIARDGLNLRSGPGTDFPVIRSLPLGSRVHIIKRDGGWALVDQEGDGAADGYVLAAYLRGDQPDAAVSTLAVVPQAGGFVPLNRRILQSIMDACGGIPIKSKLDLDVVADALNRAMLLAEAGTRLREVAFLSQSVIETDYFRTFAEYGKGQRKDYAPYYGRGMHQLTWKTTYSACSKVVFGDDRLVNNPDLILNDIEVNIKITAWYWRDYKPFNKLADASDIDEIIHRLYGGTINSPKAAVRRSVILRRSYYTTIASILKRIG